jgi:predicted Zn-dependent protease
VHAEANDPTELLEEALRSRGEGFVELRYHKKRSRALAVEKGRVDTAQVTEHSGVGVRVLEQGT